LRTNIYITLELCTALALGTSACSDDQTPVRVAGSAGAGGSSGGAPPTGGAGGGGANAGTGDAGSGASAGTPAMGGGGGTSGVADAGTRDAGTGDAAAPPDDAGEQLPPVCNIVDDQLVLPEGSSCTLMPEQMEEYDLIGENVVSCSSGLAITGGELPRAPSG
jgi:hypothetical protein